MTDSEKLRKLADYIEHEVVDAIPWQDIEPADLRRIADRLEAMETGPVVLAQRDSTESNVKEPK